MMQSIVRFNLLELLCHFLVLLPFLSPSTTFVEGVCGRDSRQIVEINNDLAIALCHENVARIFRIAPTTFRQGRQRRQKRQDEINITRNCDGDFCCCSTTSSTAKDLLKSRDSLIVQDGYAQPIIPDDGSGRLSPPVVQFNVTRDKENNTVSIQTNSMRIDLSKIMDTGGGGCPTSIVSFLKPSGELITKEIESKFKPIINSKKSGKNKTNYHIVKQSWQLDPNEGFYGGGQYVNGFVDYHSAPILMVQSNTEAVVPFFFSSKGYGILWDHYGITMLNRPSLKNEIKFPPSYYMNDSINGNATTTVVQKWTAPANGDYLFYVKLCNETDFGCNSVGGFTLSLNNFVICEHHLANMPTSVTCNRVLNVTKDKQYDIRLDTKAGATTKSAAHFASYTPKDIQLFFTPISDATQTTLETKYSNYIDYYFITTPNSPVNSNENYDDNKAGAASRRPNSPTLDSLISSYREITGTASLYSKWAYGFWQCKEHYHNQTELLNAVATFRQKKIPIDNVVQDWLYWGSLGWGPQWDKTIFPDPKGMIDELKKKHRVHFMVSVWSKFDSKTKFYKDMNNRNLLLKGSDYMDIWNPAASDRFFHYSKDAHFDIGVDSLWLDATEPENNPHLDKQSYLGNANQYYNAFSLQVSKSIHDGLKEYDNRRIFSLTRSSFAGQQRYGATLWSGDTTANWDSLRRQIAMSINYQLSGIPYWSMDTGGFFRPTDQYESDDYHKLLIRWFQFSVFTPIMRVHGAKSNTELWNYGRETQDIIVNSALSLRYRLLDYIYSGFAKVERDHYTMQRGLVLDFSYDISVLRIADQFMFGESIMLAPIYSANDCRNVYLPTLRKGERWTDFYTGRDMYPGLHQLSDIPISQIPIFVRSSIVIFSPKRQHVFENIDNQLELRIYEGGTGKENSVFTLYEDDGVDSRSLTIRPYCTTTFTWKQKIHVLTIGKRICSNDVHQGSTQTSIGIDVVFVRPGHGVGTEPTTFPDFKIDYNGSKQDVYFNSTSTSIARLRYSYSDKLSS